MQSRRKMKSKEFPRLIVKLFFVLSNQVFVSLVQSEFFFIMKVFRTLVPRTFRCYNTTEYDPTLPKMTLTLLKSLDRSIKGFQESLAMPDLTELQRRELEADIYKAEIMKKMIADPKLQNLGPYVPPTPKEQYERLQKQGIEEDEFIPPGGAVGISENHRNKV